MSQLSLNYRDSPLSVSEGASGKLQAGDRVPDLAVTVLTWEGQAREGLAEQRRASGTIFGLLNPSMFTLLYSNISDAGTRADIGANVGSWRSLMRGYQIAAAENRESEFKKLFGESSSILLVRPDGYVGFAGTEKSIAGLAAYCEKWLKPEQVPVGTERAHA